MSVNDSVEKSNAVDEKTTWQAKKSAMTRTRILDSTIECFVEHGYNNLTTTSVADVAGISRGAMRHHFLSKKDLIQAAVKHLHKKVLEDFTLVISSVPQNLVGKDLIRERLYAYWQHANSDLFLVYQEICMVARTTPELKEILEQSVKDFERFATNNIANLFEEWGGYSDSLFLAIDTTKFLIEGMALGQIVSNKDERIKRQLDYLVDRIDQIFNEGMAQSAADC
ncbi:MAG: AcrR family transcriptional regulator [Chitinophagales bacterium]|jgi:AcrR family transcriptional regulator